jgi:hypothetical protein
MSNRQLSDAVGILAGTLGQDKVNILKGSVVSVDLSSRTCVVLAITGQTAKNIKGVLLMASVDDGWLIEPEVGSLVVITYSKYTQAFVSMFSAIANVYLVVGSSMITVGSSLVKVNDGGYGGVVKVEDLVSKINRLESKVNDLITKFNNHSHILTLSSGSGTAAPTVTVETQITPVTSRDDIENTKFTHG